MQPYMKLIHRLCRLIKAKQLPHWLYDQEEGHLNPYMLTRVVASPSIPMSYVKEKITDFVPTLFYFYINGAENEDLYSFIYNFSLDMERAGAVVTEIPGVKAYKERIRGRSFDRSLIQKTSFDYDAFSKIRYKRKLLINMTKDEIRLPVNKFNATFVCCDVKDTENLLNSLYDFFDKD